MKLRSFPAIRRGNYVLKLSISENALLLVAFNVTDDSNFIVRYFTDIREADIFIETLIEKDIYG